MALRTALANPAIPDTDTLSPRGADQWNQIIYTKIAVLGDSLSAQPPLFGESWPVAIQNRLTSAGAVVQVKTFSTFSHTFFRANTTATYGSNTAVQEVIAWKPDVVIVELGGNDAIGMAFATGDNRTEAEIQADAELTYTTLKAGIPGVVLIQVNLRCFDEDNFTTSNVKNKGIISRFMQTKTSGILTGLFCSEMLDDDPSADAKQFLDVYDDLITVIDAISGVNLLEVNLFRVDRLAGGLTDRVHYGPFGCSLFAGYIIKGLRNISAFTDLVPVIAEQVDIDEGEDPDSLFTNALTASGNGYVAATVDLGGTEAVNSAWGTARSIKSDNWYLAYKASFVRSASTYYNGVGFESLLLLSIYGAQPNTAMTMSIDGASFTSTGNTTDQHGSILCTVPLGLQALSNAAHDFRFRIGSDVFGPYSITVAANIIGNVNTTAVGNVGAGEDDLITFTIPAGFAFPAAGRGIRVVQHGTFANNAAAKTLKIYFGSLDISGGGLGFTTNLAGNWHVEWNCHSTGTDAQKYEGFLTVQTAAGTWIPINFQGTATQDDGGTIVIKCTGTATNNNDIIQTFQRVYYE